MFTEYERIGAPPFVNPTYMTDVEYSRLSSGTNDTLFPKDSETVDNDILNKS